MSRILLLLLSDGLRLPTGFVAPSPYRCLIYCKVPDDWVTGSSLESNELWLKGPALKPDKLEILYQALYGKTWRAGNADGSQYVVMASGARLLNPLRAGERPWQLDDPHDQRFRSFYFAAAADEQFAPIAPAQL